MSPMEITMSVASSVATNLKSMIAVNISTEAKNGSGGKTHSY